MLKTGSRAMPISRDQAQDALRDIAQAERRSSSAYGYKSAAPFLILWGLLWIVGYGGTDLWPDRANAIWLGVLIVGTAASTFLGMRIKSNAKPRFDWRIFATWLAALVFISAMLAVFKPVNGAQVGALIPLLVACSYVVMGIWTGVRLVFAGLIIAALTLGGFFYLPSHFALWMAAVGGGCLIATGLWLRSA
jgi:hypothetical protein